MRRFLAAAIVCAALPARADRLAADKLASEAETLAKLGDLAGAAQKFRAAYSEDPRPELMCNVGVAFYKAVDLPRAQRYLAQCKELSGKLDPAFVANVEQVLASVEQRLAQGDFTRVQLVVEPATAVTTIQGSPFDEPFVGSRTAWLPFGTYTVSIHAEGYVDHEEVVHATDRTPVTVTARLDRPKLVVPPPPPPPAISSPPRDYKLPIVVSGATAAVAVFATASWIVASSHASTANDLATRFYRPPYDAEASDADTWKHVTWVTGGIALAGAAVSGYLWYRATRGPQVELTASPSGAGMSLGGAW